MNLKAIHKAPLQWIIRQDVSLKFGLKKKTKARRQNTRELHSHSGRKSRHLRRRDLKLGQCFPFCSWVAFRRRVGAWPNVTAELTFVFYRWKMSSSHHVTLLDICVTFGHNRNEITISWVTARWAQRDLWHRPNKHIIPLFSFMLNLPCEVTVFLWMTETIMSLRLPDWHSSVI